MRAKSSRIPAGDAQFLSTVRRDLEQNKIHKQFDAAICSDMTLFALDIIPVDKIHVATTQRCSESEPFTHALVKSLLAWFKNDVIIVH